MEVNSEDFELDIDPHTVCRVCLSQTNILQNLFASTIVDGYYTTIPEMVNFSLGIHASQNDELPDKICNECRKEITKFYIFKRKSKRTEETLHKMFKKNLANIKEEAKIQFTTFNESVATLLSVEPQSNIICKDCGVTFTSELFLNQHNAHLHSIATSENISIKTENAVELLDILEDSISKCSESEEGDLEADEVAYKVNEVNISVIEEEAETLDDAEEEQNYYAEEINDDQLRDDQSDDIEISLLNSHFINENELKKHMDQKQKENKFPCKFCSNSYSNENSVKRHMTICHRDRNDDSNKTVYTESIDTENVEKSGNEKIIEFIVTDKELQSDDSASNYLDEINDIYECYICDEMFDDRKLYLQHCKEHNFFCYDCQISYENVDDFVKHNLELHVDKKRLSKLKAYKCGQCNKTYKTRSQYEQHTKVHESMNIITNYLHFHTCHVCRIIFLSSEKLSEHIADSHKNKEVLDELCTDYQFLEDDDEIEYVCGVCAIEYPNVQEAKYHIVAHLEKFLCPFDGCGCQYDMFSRLSLHITNKHINGQLYLCKHCNKRFDTFDDLQKHIKKECPERKFLCSHCDKKFFSKKALQHHIKNSKGKKFMCQYCGKSFSQQGELTIHNRSHTGERPFQCTICGKAYKTSSMRTAHMDAHIEGKTFPCTMCDKKLQTRTSYRNHMKRHTEEKKHSCERCGKKFFTKYHVKLHTMKIHEKIMKSNKIPMIDLQKNEFMEWKENA